MTTVLISNRAYLGYGYSLDKLPTEPTVNGTYRKIMAERRRVDDMYISTKYYERLFHEGRQIVGYEKNGVMVRVRGVDKLILGVLNAIKDNGEVRVEVK